MLDPDEPFFRPVWRRYAVVLVSLGWAVFEASNGNTLWALFFAGIGIYTAWVFLVKAKRKDD